MQGKTEAMLFGTSKNLSKHHNSLNILYGSEKIETKSTYRYLWATYNRIFVIACSMTAINNIEVILYIFARFRHLNVRQQSLFIWRFFIDVHDVHLRRIFSFKYNILGLFYKSIQLVFSRRTRPSVNKKAIRYNGNYHHSVHLLPQRR